MQASALAHQRAAAGAQAASAKPSSSPLEVGARRRGAMVPARALLLAHHQYHYHHRAAALVVAARLALSAAACSSSTASSVGHRRVSSVAAATADAAAGQAPPSSAAPPSATLVDAAQRERLASFLDHLLLTNESMNLTAVRDRDEAWTRHVEDSLALVPVIERWAAAVGAAAAAASGAAAGGGAAAAASAAAASGKKKNKAGRKKQSQQAWFEEEEEEEQEAPAAPTPAAAPTTPTPPPTKQQQLRLIDVGTGPGLPGMILAIARPTWRVTLLDSLRKRCDFLRAAASRLELTNVEVVWSRAEDAGRQPLLRDAHDVAVARAVAETRVLAELCLPFVRPGGVWVAAKGAAIEGEVEAAAKAIAALKGRVLAVEPVESFYGSSANAPVEASAANEDDDNAASAAAAAAVRRTAIVVEKLAPTPSAYPRPPGTPNKKPL